MALLVSEVQSEPLCAQHPWENTTPHPQTLQGFFSCCFWGCVYFCLKSGSLKEWLLVQIMKMSAFLEQVEDEQLEAASQS